MKLMKITNDKTFKDNRYTKVTLNSKLIGVAKSLISTDYREF